MSTPVTDFNSREKISDSRIDVGAVFDVAVPLFLPYRRVYLYLEGNNVGGGVHGIFGVVNLMRLGRVVGQLPARIGDVTSLNQSEPCIFNSGGNVIGDTINLRLAQPFAATNSVLLQPMRLNAEIDNLQFYIQSKFGTNLVGYRVYLGCLSSTNY